MTILHVDSSIHGDKSVSRALSHSTVAHLAALNPTRPIIRRDLAAAPLPHLVSGETDPSVAEEFLSAQTIIVGAPMYNFGIPSQLKAWLDRLAIPGKTFRYDAHGPEGLCGGRKVIVVSSRGGVFSAGSPYAAFDHQEGHLQAFFTFLGIPDITFVRAEGLALGEEAQRRALQTAESEILKLVA
ncbi:NAD(P)H-dependent oxidoreductase [Nitrospirillum sp. BR 11752]|uniref:FMN-dependent NADH-azoreductase n=1 Tax=Nitrospirillum sp. BR 11752 TaxID=3104293 RepID=UPI002ECA611A|nr:NAD(P)H-dependent oxidoreductase [Nitrospirillum sp. BR 11752]